MSDDFDQPQYTRPRELPTRRRALPPDGALDDGYLGADQYEPSDTIDDTSVDIFYLLDSLEELVSVGKRFPFSGKVMVAENEFLALVDQLRMAVPNEVKQAQRVIRERQAIIEEAHADAVRISDAARQSAEYFVSQEGILAAARLKGEQILQDAEKARNRHLGEIDAYALELIDNVTLSMRNGWAMIEESIADAQAELLRARDQIGE